MNKKLFFVAILGLLMGTAGFSQSYLGARVGANFSNVLYAHEDPNPRIGLQGGMMGLINLSKYEEKLYLQPEVNYSNQGEIANPYNLSGEKVSQKVFFNYVNIPVQLKYYLQGKGNYFYVSAGPYIGFQITDKIEFLEDGAPTLATDFNEYKTTKSVDYGAVGEIGYSVTKNLEVSLRYAYGIPDRVKNVKSTNNSVITVGINYFIDLTNLFGGGGCYF